MLEKGLHYLTMDGRAVFKWAVRILADSAQVVLEHAGCQVAGVRWFIPHQANVRIIHAASDVLGFHRDAVFKNLERYGNTSAGSIPIALDELNRDGAIERGDLILTSGFGAGLELGHRALAVVTNASRPGQRLSPTAEPRHASRGRGQSAFKLAIAQAS